ncbi:MAG: nucleotide disphospho-sugar-binding domain-containing protein, partial [Candidatus Eisenbacteria bacterium]
PAGLEEFLTAGDPALVFTLGSSAVHLAGDFYTVSLRAAARLGRRALLLVGRETKNVLPSPLPPGIAAFDYVPFSEVLPRGAATIHQGGVGTTAQAMRAGRPMLVVPFAHDQYDHAARITRRGIGLTLERSHYDEPQVAAALARLLGEPSFAARAAEVGARVRAERGAAAAADAIGRVLAGARTIDGPP